MPQVIVAAASVIGGAVFAVTGSVTLGVAVADFGAALAFTSGIAAGVSAWATVASVATLAMGKPKVGGVGGTQVDFRADPRAGIPYAIGRTGAAGQIVFGQVSGDKNKYLNYVTVLSGAGPIEAIESFQANDQTVTFSADSGEGASGFYLNRMWMRTQLGASPESGYLHWTATGSKDTPSNHNGMPVEWTSTHKLSGFAAALWGLQYKTEVYPAGPPKPLWVLKGAKVYDPRLDSTYPGGSGSHRSNNEATWTWSENPFLHALTWCIGRRQNGKRVLGIGAPIGQIDVAAFVEGANVADANGWKISGVVYSTDGKYDVLDAMLRTGGGWVTQLGALISCGVQAPRVSLATMTIDDAAGDVTVSALQPRRDRVNGIIPSYRSETHGWEVVPADLVQVSAYVTADGSERTREVDWPLVPDVDQVAQLARYVIEDSREFGPITVPAKPRWMGYRPNDCVTIDEPEWGLAAQKVLILKRERDPATGMVTLTMRSETDGKHAFALGETGTPPPAPGLAAVDPTFVPPVTSAEWTVTAGSLGGTSGSLPLINLAGAPDVAVGAIIVEYRERLTVGPPATYGPWVTEQFAPTATKIQVTNVKPGATYEVRVRYMSAAGVEDATTGQSYGTFTVGGLVSATEADTTAPGAPTGLTASAAFETIFLTFTNPADADLDKIEVYEGTTSGSQALLTTLSARPGAAGFYPRSGLGNGVTRYYKLRAIDRAGNASAFTAVVNATTARLVFDDFTAGIEPVGRGAGLPSGVTYAGNLWLNTTDNKLYRYNGSSWVAAVAASDVTGQLTNSQIADLAAAKLTGTITTTQIANNAITTPLLNAGAVTTAKIAALNVTASEIAASAITTAKLSASAVTANELAANAVTATKIAAGVITASHIASATITGTQIAASTITAANIAAGTISADRIVANSIDAARIAVGGVTTTGIALTAVTDSASARNAAAKVVSAGGTDTLLDCAIATNTADASVRIDFTAYLNPIVSGASSGDPLTVDWANIRVIRWNGGTPTTLATDVLGTAVKLPDGDGGYNYIMPGGRVAMSWNDEPGSAGSWAYSIFLDALSASPTTVGVTSRTLNLLRTDR